MDRRGRYLHRLISFFVGANSDYSARTSRDFRLLSFPAGVFSLSLSLSLSRDMVDPSLDMYRMA